MTAELTAETTSEVNDTQPKKRSGAQKLGRSVAWRLAVARMTDETKLPEGGKG